MLVKLMLCLQAQEDYYTGLYMVYLADRNLTRPFNFFISPDEQERMSIKILKDGKRFILVTPDMRARPAPGQFAAEEHLFMRLFSDISMRGMIELANQDPEEEHMVTLEEELQLSSEDMALLVQACEPLEHSTEGPPQPQFIQIVTITTGVTVTTMAFEQENGSLAGTVEIRMDDGPKIDFGFVWTREPWKMELVHNDEPFLTAGEAFSDITQLTPEQMAIIGLVLPSLRRAAGGMEIDKDLNITVEDIDRDGKSGKRYSIQFEMASVVASVLYTMICEPSR